MEGPDGSRRCVSPGTAAIPDLQLALVGSMALDDPDGWGVYQQVQAEVAHDADAQVACFLDRLGRRVIVCIASSFVRWSRRVLRLDDEGGDHSHHPCGVLGVAEDVAVPGPR